MLELIPYKHENLLPMKKIDDNEINSLLKTIKKKLVLEVDENKLIREVTQLSTEINSYRQEKEELEILKRLLDVITSEYFYCFDHKMTNEINAVKKNIDLNRDELMKIILFKTQKLANFELLMDFVSYESFEQVAEIHAKKNTGR